MRGSRAQAVCESCGWMSPICKNQYAANTFLAWHEAVSKTHTVMLRERV